LSGAARSASEDTRRQPPQAALNLEEPGSAEGQPSTLIPVEQIAQLVGHSGTTVTELVYRH